LLLIAWYWTFKSLRHIRKTDRHWDLRVMMEGSLLATFVSGLFVGIMYEKFTWLVFALLAMARTVTLPAAIERDVELEPAGLPAGQQPAIATQKFPLVPS
jgi:hypothetical protein